MVETIMVMLEISHRIQCLRVQNTCGNFSVCDLSPLLSFLSAPLLFPRSSGTVELQPSCLHGRQEAGNREGKKSTSKLSCPLLRDLSLKTSLMLHWLHLAVLKNWKTYRQVFFFFLFYCGISNSYFNLVITCNSL